MSISILRMPALSARVGLKGAAIYNRLNPKSRYYDATFPRPISLGSNSNAVGWIESEVTRWLEEQVEKTRVGGNRASIATHRHPRAGSAEPSAIAAAPRDTEAIT